MSANSDLSQLLPESNYITRGSVGHLDISPAFARIENNRVLIEVTLAPSGEEVVAELPVSDGGYFGGLQYGQRVIVAIMNGTSDDYVILARSGDNDWPMPTAVSGVPIAAPLAPCWHFLKTRDGQLLAIETGDGADVTIHSGGSIRLGVNGGEQILLSGETHIGADFLVAPVGPQAGPDGTEIPGVPGTAYDPLPFIPIPGTGIPNLPWIGPAQGIVRAQDTIESDVTIDPNFWAWVIAVSAAPQVAAALASAAIPDPPICLKVEPKTASRNTCGD